MTLDEIKDEERQIDEAIRALSKRREALSLAKIAYGNKAYADKGISIGSKVMFHWQGWEARQSSGPFIFKGHAVKCGTARAIFVKIKKDGSASTREAYKPYDAEVVLAPHGPEGDE